MFAIVGSGFGLYGYLPALVESFGDPVLLPESSRARVEARPELKPYRDSIRWTPDYDASLAQATAVVIATPPRRQVEVASRCLTLPSIATLILEKPLAPSAQEAHVLLERLRRSGRRYRLGYTLLHTSWARDLSIPHSITWTFMAHHFAHGLHNWKRLHADGGGPLRFFGVHLLALLAHRGYRKVKQCALEGALAAEPQRWRALLSGEGLPDCRVLVDTRSTESVFRIASGGPLVDLTDPYGAEPPEVEADRRIGVLRRFLASLDEPDARFDRLYREVDALWRATEEAAALQ